MCGMISYLGPKTVSLVQEANKFNYLYYFTGAMCVSKISTFKKVASGVFLGLQKHSFYNTSTVICLISIALLIWA